MGKKRHRNEKITQFFKLAPSAPVAIEKAATHHTNEHISMASHSGQPIDSAYLALVQPTTKKKVKTNSPLLADQSALFPSSIYYQPDKRLPNTFKDSPSTHSSLPTTIAFPIKDAQKILPPPVPYELSSKVIKACAVRSIEKAMFQLEAKATHLDYGLSQVIQDSLKFANGHRQQIDPDIIDIDDITDGITNDPNGHPNDDYESLNESDFWLPKSFSQLQASSHVVKDRLIWLLTGPTRTGKTDLAVQVALSLKRPLIEINTSNRSTKIFEDILVGAAHDQSTFAAFFDRSVAKPSQKVPPVVLIDEIDLIFPSERGFYSALSNFLSNVANKIIVYMTSNCDFTTLKRFVQFPPDCKWHHNEPSSRASAKVLLNMSEAELKSDLFRTIEYNSCFDPLATLSQTRIVSVHEDLMLHVIPYDLETGTSHSLSPTLSLANLDANCTLPEFVRDARKIGLAMQSKIALMLSTDTWLSELLPFWAIIERRHRENESQNVRLRSTTRAQRVSLSSYFHRIDKRLLEYLLNYDSFSFVQ